MTSESRTQQVDDIDQLRYSLLAFCICGHAGSGHCWLHPLARDMHCLICSCKAWRSVSASEATQ